MWTRVDNPVTATAFRQVLAECDDYVPYLDPVMANVTREDVEAWYWEGPDFRLALAYKLSIDNSYANIIVGVPSPEGDPQLWCRVMIRKLRSELDPKGATEWVAEQKSDYESEHMADFADAIDRVCHEFAGENIKSDGRRGIRFDRAAVDKSKDKDMVGPGKNRPPRVRRVR